MEALGDVGIVGEDESVSEIFGVVAKNFVVDFVAERHEVFFDEDRGGAGVTLVERVDLPDVGSKIGDAIDFFRLRQREIVHPGFCGEVVF